jgi:hypothetical protein
VHNASSCFLQTIRNDQPGCKQWVRDKAVERTLDVTIFQLLIVVELLAVENQTNLNDINAFFFLQLVLETKNLENNSK